MVDLTLADLAEDMKNIDFAMLFTKTENGDLAGRPMSNNGDVEYNGSSFYFTFEQSRTVADIERDAKVALSFQGSKGLLGRPPLFVAVEGVAELIRERSEFDRHWTKDLDRWFENGADTPGIVLIKIDATRIHYWKGEEDGEIIV
jgi:general stress protein 26